MLFEDFIKLTIRTITSVRKMILQAEIFITLIL